ncbi:dual specificity protein phosphatase 22 [Plakobranchus ocellatus]|uniref:Dual specificity protein phosphatase 15 n=1 Tax=Plakobranchus ocellatus TaxID=259542 RepID=A0AAV4CMM5_9GAST|nr:dual specificity protein phosphatase 22 [Plakobranchus ocellatus]
MSIFLYACEAWILNADIERRIRAMEMRCFRRLLGISYEDHITNEEVSRRIENAIGPHVDLLTIIRQWKLKWYGHTTHSSGLAKTIMQGTILSGLYIGNFRDAKDLEQLENNNITHIVSIHDNAKKILDSKEYLCIQASDSPDQDLSLFFPQVINFIHRARLEGGGVLVHCLAGVSRSVTITAAYIMTVTNLSWRDALNSIRGARTVANPNFGFQKQLQNYESEHIEEERKKFKATFPHPSPFNDEEECRQNLHSYQHYLMTGKTLAKSQDLYPLPPRAYQSSSEKKYSPTKGGSKDISKVEADRNGPNDDSIESGNTEDNHNHHYYHNDHHHHHHHHHHGHHHNHTEHLHHCDDLNKDAS